MVFQNCGFETSSYNPINMNHGAAVPIAIGAASGSKKRKAFDSEGDVADHDNAAYPSRPKLCLPRSAGLIFNGDAQFHPLPPEVNQAILAQLASDPFSSHSSVSTTIQSSPTSSFATMTPSSSSYASGFVGGHQHKSSNGSDYFGSAHTTRYPDVEPYPSSSPTNVYGIMEPAYGSASSDSMDMDDGSKPQGHGSHCKSIPQLCVRYNDGTSSELWATCPDCGACSKVESTRPSSNLCYSP